MLAEGADRMRMVRVLISLQNSRFSERMYRNDLLNAKRSVGDSETLVQCTCQHPVARLQNFSSASTHAGFRCRLKLAMQVLLAQMKVVHHCLEPRTHWIIPGLLDNLVAGVKYGRMSISQLSHGNVMA